jgi:hypothetical protein
MVWPWNITLSALEIPTKRMPNYQYTVYGTLSCVFERNSGKIQRAVSWKIPILLYSGCMYRGLSTGTYEFRRKFLNKLNK